MKLSIENQDKAPMRISEVGEYELERWYTYKEYTLIIPSPWRVFIAESGSHRVQSNDGTIHYIPHGWISLSWTPRDVDDPVKF